MTNKSKFVAGWFALAALWSLSALGAEQFAKGHGALEVFDADGVAASPLWVQLWVGFMVLTFAVGLIFFVWKRPIARWAVGGFLFSALTGEFIFSALGLPFLSGSIAIMHLLGWTPALVLLLIRRPFLDANEGQAFRIWSGVMIFVILFSFVFDIRDAFLYIQHFSGLG